MIARPKSSAPRSRAIAVAAWAGILATALSAQPAPDEYDYRERTRELAFNPERFFPGFYGDLHMSVVYMGDDYDYPVYAFAIRRGCTKEDTGEARKTCWKRRIARMVRSPWAQAEEPPERPRWRGMQLFGALSKFDVTDDAALSEALTDVGTEWLEADLAECPAALAKLETFDAIDFTRNAPKLPDENNIAIVLHADTIAFEYGNYLDRTRHFGALHAGSPAEWANDFVDSFEACWAPASSPPPWTLAED